MKILIIGSGAVGGYFGARLQQAGNHVTFFARGLHLQHLKTKGLTLSSINGDAHLEPIEATDNVNTKQVFDVILVCVKTFQIAEILSQLKSTVSDKTLVIPLANGVDAIEQLQAVVPKAQLIGGLAKIISFVKAPGHINHVGADPHITLGELDGEKSPRLRELAAVLADAKISHGITSNIESALWRKYLFVASWGAIAGLTRVSIGAIRQNVETRTLVEQVMHEYKAIALAHGVSLPDTIVADTMAFIDALPAHSETSLQRDVVEQRTSELDSLLGYALSLAKKYQLSTPVLSMAYACLDVQQTRNK